MTTVRCGPKWLAYWTKMTPSDKEFIIGVLFSFYVLWWHVIGTLFKNYFHGSDDFFIISYVYTRLTTSPLTLLRTFFDTWIENRHHSLYYRPLMPLGIYFPGLLFMGQPCAGISHHKCHSSYPLHLFLVALIGNTLAQRRFLNSLQGSGSFCRSRLCRASTAC